MNGTLITSRARLRKAAPRRSETKQLRRPAITDAGAGRANNSRHVTPDSLSQMLADFLEGARAAVVVEDGAIVFDLAESKYSISGEYHKCLLHLWSSERNLVRRVLDAEVKTTTLRLQGQRMGQNRPTRLDFCRDRDRRSPAARRAARTAYEPRLRRALGGSLSDWPVVRVTQRQELQHSFGPPYLRSLLRQRQWATAM